MPDNASRIAELKKMFAGLQHRLVIISGPSAGAGKGKVIDELLRTTKDPLWLSVSTTTRQPRPGEVLHHLYNFVDKAEFERREADGEFLEANGVTVGNRYGTPLAPILEHLAGGDIVLLEIDLPGARAVHQVVPGALFLFIKPTDGETGADIAELRRRMEKRGTEDLAVMNRRLEQAAGELADAKRLGFYDHWVVNASGKSDEAARKVYELILAHATTS